MEKMSVIEKAIQWAVSIAADNSHGYDQIHRWGPDYDCSSLAISAYRAAGLELKGATYTGNMRAAFIKDGFKSIPYKNGMSPSVVMSFSTRSIKPRSISETARSCRHPSTRKARSQAARQATRQAAK